MSDQILRQFLSRGFRLRCPNCGVEPLFRRPFQMNVQCRYCGLVYEREQGYFIGAIYISVIIVESTLLLVALIYYWQVGSLTSTIIYVLVAMAVLLPFLLFHHSRSLWLCIDHYIDPPKQERN